MTQYLQDALPDELIDAARVDGCNLIRTFWHVAMPAARPAAAMLFLFTFVGKQLVAGIMAGAVKG